jgi:DNA-binding response OmpR family regulator
MARRSDVADRSCRVLLVEDDRVLAGLIKEVLAETQSGPLQTPPFEVVVVGRLGRALTRLERGDIHVVLLDLSLPDSRGLDTFTKTHAHAPDVPIVVLSALDDEALAASAVRQGAQDYLVKGQMPLELVARSLRYAIERHRAEANLIREQMARAAAEEALRQARRADRLRRQRQRRELRSLEQLSAPSTVAVTAQVFGVEPLRRTVPEQFRNLVQRYGQLLELGVEQRTHKVDYRLSDTLRTLAEELGFLNAGPRDVVELHTAALKQRIAVAAPAKAQAYIDEARIMVLELMGYLVAYYRS